MVLAYFLLNSTSILSSNPPLIRLLAAGKQDKVTKRKLKLPWELLNIYGNVLEDDNDDD